MRSPASLHAAIARQVSESASASWFRAHRRELPWRASSPAGDAGRDPYRIWIAEIMLQQTRIAAVLPYYERSLRAFPTSPRWPARAKPKS